MYLLDTNVVSELRKPRPDRHVKRWAGSVAAASLFLSTISVLELETGVLRSQAAHLLELATILSMMVSMYLIVWRYPTPIAISDELRRN